MTSLNTVDLSKLSPEMQREVWGHAVLEMVTKADLWVVLGEVGTWPVRRRNGETALLEAITNKVFEWQRASIMKEWQNLSDEKFNKYFIRGG